MRVALPLDVTWVGCDTSCTNQRCYTIKKIKDELHLGNQHQSHQKLKHVNKRETFNANECILHIYNGPHMHRQA